MPNTHGGDAIIIAQKWSTISNQGTYKESVDKLGSRQELKRMESFSVDELKIRSIDLGQILFLQPRDSKVSK